MMINKTVLHSSLALMALSGTNVIAGSSALKSRGVLPKDPLITTKIAQQILEANAHYAKDGDVANYIPELGKMRKDAIALSIVSPDGKIISVGDTNQKFTVQSVSKIISLMVAIQELGESAVFNNMGYYGSDKPFNYSANLEANGKPLNPMMNAGAILTTSLIPGDGDVGYQKILEMIRFITNNPDIDINEAVYLSEKETGHRNRAMYYMMINSGFIDYTQQNEDKLDNYFKQCSIEVTAQDLAKIGYFFANDCVRYDGNDKFKNTDLARLIQSVMFSGGMYEFSGEYARRVGLPSKSGVGGGIVVSANKGYGIGVFSPSLDAQGNSIAGYHMLVDIATLLDLNIF